MITVQLPEGGSIDVDTDDPQAASQAAKGFLAKETPTERVLRVTNAAAGEPGLFEAVQEAVPFADEAAAIGSAVGLASSALFDPREPSVVGAFKTAYSTRLAQLRERQRQAREKFGILPNIIAGLGTLGAAGATGAGAAALPTAGQRAVTGLRAGTLGGGVGGVAEGEGAGGRIAGGLTGAAIGAPVGAAVGAAAPQIARGIQAVVSPVQQAGQAVGRGAQRIFAQPRLRDVRARRVERVLERSGQTPEQALARLEGAQAQGTPVGIADVTGEAGRRELRGAVQFPGRGSTLAEEMAANRQALQSGRIQERLNRMLSVNNREFHATQQAIIRDRATNARGAYRDAFAGQQPFNIRDELEALEETIQSQRGRIRRQLEQARNLYTDQITRADGTRVRVPVQDLRQYQSARQNLDEMINRIPSNPGSVGAVARRELTAFRDAANARVREANPLFARADDEFSGSRAMQNAIEDGRNFARGDFEATADEIADMTPGQRDMFRVGVMREVRQMLGRKAPRNDQTLLFQQPNFQNALRSTFPQTQQGQADFRRFMDTIRDEIDTTQTLNIALRNSTTSGKIQDALDFSLFDRFAGALQSGEGGMIRAVQQELVRAVQKATRLREKDAEIVVRALLDPQQGRQILQDLAQRAAAGQPGGVPPRRILGAGRAVRNYIEENVGPALIAGEVAGRQ